MTIRRKNWTKVLTSACLLSALTLGTSHALANLIAYEGFNYERRQWSEGSEVEEGMDGLDGGFGWGGPWMEHADPGGDEFTGIAAEPRDFNNDDGLSVGARTQPLSYTDSQGRRLITKPGQARTSTQAASWTTRPLAQPIGNPGDTIWVSFLAQAGDDLDNYSFISFDNTVNAQIAWFGRVNSDSVPTTWGWQTLHGVDRWGSGGPSTLEQVLYVIKFEFPENIAENVNISIWFNPDLESEGELGEPDLATYANNPADGDNPTRLINFVTIRGRNSIDFDELRIGTTFDSVTPYGDFAENLAIARAATVRFNSESGKEYKVLHSEDGENWTNLLNGSVEGDGQAIESQFQLDANEDSFRVVISGEDYTPNPASNPALPSIAGLALHMDSSATESLVLNGFYVEEWRDAQGNDIVFTPLQIDGEETRPVYFESGVGPNNRPTLLFDMDSLDTKSPAGLGLTNDIEGITFFSVVQNTQSASQNIFRASMETGDVGIRFVQFRTGSQYGINVRRLDEDALTEVYGGERETNVWSIDGSMTDYNTGNSFLYLNGMELANGTVTTGRTAATNSEVVRIGSSTRANLANTWQGGIAEILYFNRALTNEERNAVGTYLADKYDIPYQLALETDVPFDLVESVTLSFAADIGETYSIEWTNDLSGSWNTLDTQVQGLGLNERVYVTIADGVDRQFFRLRKTIE